MSAEVFEPLSCGFFFRASGTARLGTEETGRDLWACLLTAPTLLSAPRLGNRKGYCDAVAQMERLSVTLRSGMSK